MKRLTNSKYLLEREIRDAQDRARSAREAARLLSVSYNTYKKYAKMYGIFDRLKNKSGIGVPKGFSSGKFRNKYPLKEILENKHPKYPAWKLVRRLVDGGYKEEKCECCGFSEHRLVDDKIPIKVNFKDGNKKNYEFNNIEFLCYNCYFLQVDNPQGRRVSFKFTTND